MIIILTRLSHGKTITNPEVDEEQRKITKQQGESNGDFEETLYALLCRQATYSPVPASQTNNPRNTDLNMDDKEPKRVAAGKSEISTSHQFGDASETISKIRKLVMPYLAGYLDLEDVQDTPEAACHAILKLIVFDDRFDDRQDVLDNVMHFLILRYGQMAIADSCVRAVELRKPNGQGCVDFNPAGFARAIGKNLYAEYFAWVNYAARTLFPAPYEEYTQEWSFKKVWAYLIAAFHQTGIIPTEAGKRLDRVCCLVAVDLK